MPGQRLTRRADRPWPIAALAAATWAQPWAMGSQHVNPWSLAIWTTLVVLTALPLVFTDPWTFRQTCLIIGAVLLGTESMISLPTLLTALPVLVALFPAGALLLVAGWKRPGPARIVLTAVLLAVPGLTGVTSLLTH